MTTYWSNRAVNVGPTRPTVSWRKGMFDSKIHFFGVIGRTLCGKRIPKHIESGDSWDMCERCVKIAGAKHEII